ncbi:MAG TPA: hypothetical protein VER55_06350 [Ardenticatenaceae bacterium]|nr:hypothetical protein [Ardenticatenaceae bacterium]
MMSVEIPNDLIEIRDPEIDPGVIMEQIRERVRRRRDELGYEKRTFPTFGLTACPVEPDDVPFDPNLYHHLRLANTTYDQVEVAPILVPSPATRTPVVGRLWALVRWHFHTLILFYVNRAVRHQTGVNRHLISVLNQLTALTQEQQRTIVALQAEIETLRQQIGK